MIWDERLKQEEDKISDIEKLEEKYLKESHTNYPPLKEIGSLQKENDPLMICECGFGHTTYELLKWCIKNDAYLITINMPELLERYKEKIDVSIVREEQYMSMSDYEYLRHWGVNDKYTYNYYHCIKLDKVAKKRWIWINDNIFVIIERIMNDKDYREELFRNGKIDYFYEDAIHDEKYLERLYHNIKPFLNNGAVFTGDDNCPTYFIEKKVEPKNDNEARIITLFQEELKRFPDLVELEAFTNSTLVGARESKIREDIRLKKQFE